MNQSNACIFCSIARKEVSSGILYEDDELVAFKDINPKAPVHFLIIPKKHVDNHLLLDDGDFGWLGRLHALANRLARDLRIDNGFRLVMNCGEGAGQTVNHLHVHVMGGRNFHWPPG